MKGRIERLRALLAQDGLDAALINGAAGIRYFSGFTSEDATVLVTGRSCCLFTDFRYTIQAREQTEGYEVVECDPAHLTEALAAVRKAIELNPTEDRLRENEKYILAALK